MTLPNAPQGFAAIVSGVTVKLSWTANPQSDGIIEYRIYRTPAVWFVPETAAVVVGTSCIDSSGELLPNTMWYYFAVAVNAAGTSHPSTPTIVTIP